MRRAVRSSRRSRVRLRVLQRVSACAERDEHAVRGGRMRSCDVRGGLQALRRAVRGHQRSCVRMPGDFVQRVRALDGGFEHAMQRERVRDQRVCSGLQALRFGVLVDERSSQRLCKRVVFGVFTAKRCGDLQRVGLVRLRDVQRWVARHGR